MSKELDLNEFSFEVNAPSALLLNKRIDDRSYRLYGVIKGLTKAHGYCYATNGYLAKALNTSEPTIKRAIKSLKDEGVIEIQTDKTGIHWQRRIYLGGGIKKCLRRITGDLPLDHGRSTPSSPVIHNNTIVNKNVLDKETPPTPQRGEREFYGKFVQLTKEEFAELETQHGTDVILSLIMEINDYLASTGKKTYKDYAATIRNWLRRRKDSIRPKEALAEENKKLAIRIDTTLKHPDIELLESSLGFINRGAGSSLYISFADLGFKEQVLNRLRKMNLPTEGF